MTRTLSLLLFSLFALSLAAHDKTRYDGNYHDAENRINLVLDLTTPSVDVPGYGFLGKTNGFMNGNIYGIWIVTEAKVHHDHAIVRFSNDQGADSQTIRLELSADGQTLSYTAVGGNEVKRVSGRKLVKIPSKLTFKRVK